MATGPKTEDEMLDVLVDALRARVPDNWEVHKVSSARAKTSWVEAWAQPEREAPGQAFVIDVKLEA